MHVRDLDLDFEIPFRELGFHGVPHRTTAFVMPTVTCLVELIEMPFTCVGCADILCVNLERVGFNLRNFDMAVIYKVGTPVGWRRAKGYRDENCTGYWGTLPWCVSGSPAWGDLHADIPTQILTV